MEGEKKENERGTNIQNQDGIITIKGNKEELFNYKRAIFLRLESKGIVLSDPDYNRINFVINKK